MRVTASVSLQAHRRQPGWRVSSQIAAVRAERNGHASPSASSLAPVLQPRSLSSAASRMRRMW